MKRNYFFSICCFSILLLLASCSGNGPSKNVSYDTVARETIVDSNTRYIYITFDDGPLEGSEDIDDAVRKEKIKVNVFVVGQHVLSSPRMQSYYHLYETNPFIEIGNHSFSHAHDHYAAYYKNPASVLFDFIKCQDSLHIPTMLARQPGRNQWRINGKSINDVSSGKASADSLYKRGFKVFGWDVEWQHDSKTGAPIQTVDDMAELIGKKLDQNKTVTPHHLVLLAHDEMFRNGWEESELKQLIDILKTKKNYRFEHLSKYPG